LAQPAYRETSFWGELVSSKNTRQVRIKPYSGPVGGWGSVKGVTEILLREAIPLKGSLALWRQNKPRGFACVSCSYGRPPHLSAFEFCENGAKATAGVRRSSLPRT